MIKKINIAAAILLTFFTLYSHGVDVSEIKKWNENKYYQRGELIIYKDNHYLSAIPSSGFTPNKYKWLWKKINLDANKPLKLKNLYFSGAVVNHDAKKFIAKTFNFIWSPHGLSNTKEWIEITDKTDGYVLPEFDEDEALATLLGTDTNHNGIRDDYETNIVLSDLPKEIKNNALKAGEIYTSAMKSGHSGITTQEEAVFIAQGLIHSYRCKLQVAKDNKGHGWKESYFYNTVDRLQVKFSTSNLLARLISKDTNFKFPEDACAALTAF